LDKSTPDNETRDDFAKTFAAFAARLNVADLPGHVVEAARINLFDTLACGIAGYSANGVKQLASLVTDWGGKPEATTWCTNMRVPAHHAAFVNGMMAHARDYDDTHDAAVLHAGVSVIPAALAAAELNPSATGADLIAGIVVGLELICRLGKATSIGIIESGFIYTALFGHFAATAAAAKVLALDATMTHNALGIAYSQASGTHQVTRDAALTKRIQPGFAAKSGLLSVAMSRAGIGGARLVFEGEDGLFPTYLRGRYEPEVLRRALGEEFDFVDLSYKPYPCCRFNHTAIDAALELRRKLGGDVAGVRQIRAGVNNQSYQAVCTPTNVRKAPEAVVQAQFSLPYTVACALIHGEVGLKHFTDQGIQDEAVRAVAAIVDAYVDENIERDWSRSVSPTRLVAVTDGGELEIQINQPRGSATNPMSKVDFDHKLRDCIAISGLNWGSDRAVHLTDAIGRIEKSDSGASIVRALRS
jgi:2-methylcitrate dehydratase PrpD